MDCSIYFTVMYSNKNITFAPVVHPCLHLASSNSLWQWHQRLRQWCEGRRPVADAGNLLRTVAEHCALVCAGSGSDFAFWGVCAGNMSDFTFWGFVQAMRHTLHFWGLCRQHVRLCFFEVCAGNISDFAFLRFVQAMCQTLHFWGFVQATCQTAFFRFMQETCQTLHLWGLCRQHVRLCIF